MSLDKLRASKKRPGDDALTSFFLDTVRPAKRHAGSQTTTRELESNKESKKKQSESSEKSKSKSKRNRIDVDPSKASSIIALPSELLIMIFNFLDQDAFHSTSINDRKHIGELSTRSLGRRDLYNVRNSCKLFKALCDNLQIWAAHCIIRTGTNPLNISSSSPFKHTSDSMRCVTSFSIIVPDCDGEISDEDEITILQSLALCPNIQSLNIIGSKPYGESVMLFWKRKTSTRVERLLRSVSKQVVLAKLDTLTLTNILIRTEVVDDFIRTYKHLRAFEADWGNFKIPKLRKQRKPKSSEDIGSSALAKMVIIDGKQVEDKEQIDDSDDSEVELEPTKIIRRLFNLSDLTAEHLKPSCIDPEAHNLRIINVSGPQSLIINDNWIQAKLHQLSIDLSTMSESHGWILAADLISWTQQILSNLKKCPHISILSLHMGHNSTKTGGEVDLALDFNASLGKIASNNLSTLSIDAPFSCSTQDFARLSKKLKLVEKLLLQFKPKASTGFASQNSFVHNLQALVSNTNQQFSNTQPGFFPAHASPFGLFASWGQQTPSNKINESQNNIQADTKNQDQESPDLFTSMTAAVSQNCSRLVELTLRFVEPPSQASSEPAEKFHALTNLPRLKYLSYNLCQLDNNSFENASTRFPKLRHLNLSFCHQIEKGALKGLENLEYLETISFEGVAADSYDILQFLGQRTWKKMKELDLRLTRPYGVDGNILHKIAVSCPNLKVLRISISPGTHIHNQIFGSLLKKCPKLRTIHLADKTSVSNVVINQFQNHGLKVIVS